MRCYLLLLFRHASLSFPSPLFSFTAPPTPETSPLSLHDALPIYGDGAHRGAPPRRRYRVGRLRDAHDAAGLEGVGRRDRRHHVRSEEHTSELQSLTNLVCRLLLEKKKTQQRNKRNTSTYVKQSYV